MEHQAWLEEIAERWNLVRDKKKRPASAVDPSPGQRLKRYRVHHSDTPDYIQLTGTLIRQTGGRFSRLGLRGPTARDPWPETQHAENTAPDTINWADTARGRSHLHTTVSRLWDNLSPQASLMDVHNLHEACGYSYYG